MRNNSTDGTQVQVRKPALLATEADSIEFNLSLHVYKKLGRDGTPDLYIIGVWNGTTAEALCLWQPLETALQALGRSAICKAVEKTV